MPKTLFKEVPKNYALCLRDDCACAKTCLHRLAYESQRTKSSHLWVINPDCCVPDTSCPYYRDSAPVIFARGFQGMQERMLPAQYRKFRELLSGQSNLNKFYLWRRGEFALSPEEQNQVLWALRQAGVTDELPFDRYEESICW